MENNPIIRPLDYVEDIKNVDISDNTLKEVRLKLTDNLEILSESLKIAFDDLNKYNLQITSYWEEYGQNYDIIPELSSIPLLQNAIKNYIIITYKEKLILVKAFINLLSNKQKLKQNKEVLAEKSKIQKNNDIMNQKLQSLENEEKKKRADYLEKRKKKPVKYDPVELDDFRTKLDLLGKKDE